jgi:hypothetical protein
MSQIGTIQQRIQYIGKKFDERLATNPRRCENQKNNKQLIDESLIEKQKNIYCPKYNQYKSYLHNLQHGFPLKDYQSYKTPINNRNNNNNNNNKNASNRSSNSSIYSISLNSSDSFSSSSINDNTSTLPPQSQQQQHHHLQLQQQPPPPPPPPSQYYHTPTATSQIIPFYTPTISQYNNRSLSSKLQERNVSSVNYSVIKKNNFANNLVPPGFNINLFLFNKN